ncbi:MAG: hypothetical protein JWO06_1328 [Bacteroidota bacterium]|nr:hypothetical protein [Bacteroidota bacterium]
MLKFHNPLWDETETRKKAELISKAITTSSVISLTNDNGEKLLIEPFVLGIHKETGKYLLQCLKSLPLELHTDEENWLLLEVDRIQELQTTTIASKAQRKKHFSLSIEMEEIIASVSDSQKVV